MSQTKTQPSMEQPVYKIEQLNFDGPLDLLLKLLDKNKIDIYDIPIAEITNQYLEQIELMAYFDMEIASEFIVMAATLLDIKSRMLLPREQEAEEDEEDPREELIKRLLEYKRYKFIAEELAEKAKKSGGCIFGSGAVQKEFADYVPPADLSRLTEGVSVAMLQETYERLLRRMNAARNVEHEKFNTIKRERISLINCIENLVSYARKHKEFSFRQMLKKNADRTELVVSFLAVLELMHMGKITVEQENMDDELKVNVVSDASLDDIDLSNIEDE